MTCHYNAFVAAVDHVVGGGGRVVGGCVDVAMVRVNGKIYM